MALRLFKGFNTLGAHKTRQRTFYDIDLVKIDLLKHFNTRIGERVMRPDWGCAIWDWLMDPLTEGLKAKIANEAVRICQADSRVVVQEVQVTATDKSVKVDMLLNFQPLAVFDNFSLEFERRENARWGA